MEELWYKKQVTFEDAVGLVQENLGSMVDSFIAAGYWLKRIRDGQEYEEHGYQTIWACAWMEFGLAKSEASRAMSMNDKYSVDGDSPYISDKYKQYSKSQLQEMLTMSEQQIEQVSPDMTVREIREMNRPAASETDDNGLLFAWINNFVRSQFYFEKLKRIYDEMAKIDHNLMHGISNEINLCLPEMDMRNITMLIEGDIVSLLETDTGEVQGKYKSVLFDSMLMDAFADEEKNRKEPEAGIRCDVATEQVNTRSDEEFEMEIMEELEEDPDQEELNVDFNTDELLEELDTVIDAEFREMGATEEENVATSQRPELLKPDETQTAYLEAFARYFISLKHDWMLEDFQHRVLNVGKSPQEIKDHLGPMHRTWFFGAGKDTAKINMFDKYIQLWSNDGRVFMGNFDWFYLASAIERLWNVIALEEAEEALLRRVEADTEENTGQLELETTCAGQDDEIQRIRGVLEKEKKLLNDYLKLLKVGEIPEPTVYRQKIIVGALANMLYELEDTEEKEVNVVEMQQELPVLKNNDQRKQWLSEYKNWGLWYRDGNIDVNYYKFDFPDGSRLVVAEYPQRLGYWKNERTDEHYFHLLEKNKMRYDTRYDEQYRQQTDSETYLVEFLKNIQKKGDAK